MDIKPDWKSEDTRGMHVFSHLNPFSIERGLGDDGGPDTMTAPDTQPHDAQSAAALWREALEVMGATIDRSQVYGKRTPEEPDPLSLWYKGTRLMESWDDGETWKFLHFDRGDWWRFGLVVEWAKRRRLDYMINKTYDDISFAVFIHTGGMDDVHLVGEEIGPDLPTTAARWIVEYGAKIAKEFGWRG